jgi:hypothetical protein
MKVLNLIIATLITSFTYFGILKYECSQEPNMITGFVIISSSLMFLVVMIVIILLAAKVELLDDRDTEMFP